MKKDIINRRRFIGICLLSGVGFCSGEEHAVSADFLNTAALKEARFYEKISDNIVQCHVCPRECVIGQNNRGFCRTRENRKGKLYSLVYGKIASNNVDPVEKKPFYHFLPGSQVYSIATAGCNLTCKFCQNWEISQSKPEDVRTIDASPKDIVDRAVNSGSKSIAYTYNEPTVFTEFVYDCAYEGKKRGVHSIVVSNGFIKPEPLNRLCGVISGYKVDFKAFSKKFYKEVTGGDREPVLNTIKQLKKSGIWVELVHLTIPTLNDNDNDFKAMGDWIMGEIGPDVPVHFTRFYPLYLLTNLPVTPVTTLERARNIMMDKGLNFVYIGNVPGHPANSTYCPKCKKEIIKREGYEISNINLRKGACGFCGNPVPGVWS